MSNAVEKITQFQGCFICLWPNYIKRKEFTTRGSVGARRGFAVIAELHPTAHESHGRKQRFAISFKLKLGYINCWPSNVVLKYSTDRGDCLLGTKRGGGQFFPVLNSG